MCGTPIDTRTRRPRCRRTGWRWRRQYHFRVAAGINSRLCLQARGLPDGEGGRRVAVDDDDDADDDDAGAARRRWWRQTEGTPIRPKKSAKDSWYSDLRCRPRRRPPPPPPAPRAGCGTLGAPLDRWLSVVRLRCGRRCRTGNSMVMASSLRGASVRARACARAFELVAHSMCPASSPVATSSLPPSASAPMPWLMMAIVEAAGHTTTAPTRRDSRRRDGQAKNHTMETDTALGLSLSSHPLFLKSRQRLCICDDLRVEPPVSRERAREEVIQGTRPNPSFDQLANITCYYLRASLHLPEFINSTRRLIASVD